MTLEKGRGWEGVKEDLVLELPPSFIILDDRSRGKAAEALCASVGTTATILRRGEAACDLPANKADITLCA